MPCICVETHTTRAQHTFSHINKLLPYSSFDSAALLYRTAIEWRTMLCTKLTFYGGLVTYTLPVQVFVTGIKIFDQWKLRSIAWLFPSEALDHMIYIASFPGPVFRPSTEKQEKDARLYPFFCTTSDGKWAGPGNKAMIYSHLRGNWQPRIVSPVDLLIFAGFTLVA